MIETKVKSPNEARKRALDWLKQTLTPEGLQPKWAKVVAYNHYAKKSSCWEFSFFYSEVAQRWLMSSLIHSG